MISESEIEFKELSLEEEKLNSDIDNEEILKNQAIKKSIKVSPLKTFDSLAALADRKLGAVGQTKKRWVVLETTFSGSKKVEVLGVKSGITPY